MDINEKINYLKENHYVEYNRVYNIERDKLDTRYPIFCPCGKLATGLHTNSCRIFQRKLNKRIVSELHDLIPNFKIGDKIKYVGPRAENTLPFYIISSVEHGYYKCENGTLIPFKFQDNYKIIK